MSESEKKKLIELGEKIRNKRKEMKFSQSMLADKTWIDRSYISMVERWETNITYLKLVKISKLLELGIK